MTSEPGAAAGGHYLQTAIEQMLTPLVGLPLARRGRAADMELFQFGTATEWVDDRQRHRVTHEFGLHIQCPWRLSVDGRLLVGYRDMVEPPSGVSSEDFDPNEARSTRRDELLDAMVAGPPANPRVVSVAGSSVGDLAIEFEGGYRLETFRDHAVTDREDWRVIAPEGHWVLEGGRLELVQ